MTKNINLIKRIAYLPEYALKKYTTNKMTIYVHKMCPEL